MTASTVAFVAMAGLGMVLVIWQASWLRRHPPAESRVGKMTRGRLLVIGVVFVAAGVGGLAAANSESDGEVEHLWQIANRCEVALEFTVTSLDGAQRRYAIPSAALGALAVSSGAEVHVSSPLGESTFTVPSDAGLIMAEWVVAGSDCTTLEPDQVR